MSEIIAFEVRRTDVLTLSGERFTVRLAKAKDSPECAMFVLNDAGDKNLFVPYTPEAAENIAKMTEQELKSELTAILRQSRTY